MKKLLLSTILMLLALTFIVSSFKETYSYYSSKKKGGCKCYAKGSSYSPGSDLCIGGFKARCIASSGVGETAKDCGWDYLKDKNGDKISCKN